MVSRNLAKPIFPLAPDTYDRRYMDNLVQSFAVYLEQYQNPGEGRATKTVFTDPPASPSGLEGGTVWLDSTVLRIGGTPGTITFPTLNVTTLGVTGTATIATADITTGNITTGNITTGNITTGNITTANISGTATILDANITGTFSLAGTAVTASAAEINYSDITTLGTVQASKVVTADASKTINFDSASMTNVDINSGAIDGTPIGAEAASTGAFSSATVSGNFTVNTSTFFVDSVNNRVGAGTITPTRSLHAVTTDAVTNAVTSVFRVDHQSSGTPAVGIGAGMEFAVETSANNTEIGVVLEAVTTDVAGSSEDFDFVIKTMAGGAAATEGFRVSSLGVATATATDAGTNTVLDVLRLSRQSSGTPAVGIGAGMEFAVETSANNTEIGAIIEAVTTDVTSASEDFDLVVRLMDAGAAAEERLRVTSDGVIYRIQPTQNTESGAATLTIAELLTGIIQYTGAAANLTLPTGTNIENGVSSSFPTNMSFDFSVINTGSGTATIITNTGLTLTGGMTVAAGASGAFRVRKTATNTYTVYRMA